MIFSAWFSVIARTSSGLGRIGLPFSSSPSSSVGVFSEACGEAAKIPSLPTDGDVTAAGLQSLSLREGSV
jgi:hypothetical protein